MTHDTERTLAEGQEAATAPTHRALEVGSIYQGRYRIGRLMGCGGYAEVYQAVRIEDNSPVAIKILLPSNEKQQRMSRNRMLIEGHMTLDLHHPNLVRYLDVYEDQHSISLVMELVTGGDVEQLSNFYSARMPVMVMAAIGRDAARGLQELHAHGLLHRDIKPANLLLDARGVCKIGDFGLIRLMDDLGSMTLNGQVVGTPAFMAPEQARNSSTCDHRADIYSLGSTLHYLATGQAPHASTNIWATLTCLISEPFPDPRQLRPDLPADFAEIILTAGAKDLACRYQSAAQLADALDAFLSGARIPLAIAPVRTPAQNGDRCGPIVLLVDDDPLVRRLYAGRLKLDGFQVETAATASEAALVLARVTPAAVVLDLYLDHEDGAAVLRQLRTQPALAELPVVIFSNALADDARLHDLKDLDVARIVAKAATTPRALSDLLVDMLGMTKLPNKNPADAHSAEELDTIARTALAHLKALLLDLGQAGSVINQGSVLRGIAETARGLSSAAAASGRPAMAAAAEGADHFARRLADDGDSITPSQHRTLLQAITCLHQLASKPPSARTETWIPQHALVLDDDLLAARYATKALNKARIPTQTVHDPNEALEQLDRDTFGLVVSDVHMEGMNGDEFARHVRSHPKHRRVPIIFVTASKEFVCPDSAEVAHDLITKPYLMAELALKALIYQATS